MFLYHMLTGMYELYFNIISRLPENYNIGVSCFFWIVLPLYTVAE